MVHTLDLCFQGRPGTIASFLVETAEGPVLVESGPHSTLSHLEKSVQGLGYQLADLKHVFLTHIHLDHAGAAWALAKLGTRVHVHPFGYTHLHNPEKLMASATRIYGDQMDTLWGDMQAIDEGQLHAVDDGSEVQVGDTIFKAMHTPGHAKHHIAWQLNGKEIFSGDVAGIRIGQGPVQVPCPPPDIDIEAWKESLQLLRSLKPDALYLTHFGKTDKVAFQLEKSQEALDQWASWIRQAMATDQSAEKILPKFQEMVHRELTKHGLSESEILDYEAANPSDMSVGGLMRYWTKKDRDDS